MQLIFFDLKNMKTVKAISLSFKIKKFNTDFFSL